MSLANKALNSGNNWNQNISILNLEIFCDKKSANESGKGIKVKVVQLCWNKWSGPHCSLQKDWPDVCSWWANNSNGCFALFNFFSNIIKEFANVSQNFKEKVYSYYQHKILEIHSTFTTTRYNPGYNLQTCTLTLDKAIIDCWNFCHSVVWEEVQVQLGLYPPTMAPPSLLC